MYALTIRQPWAFLTLEGEKPIEWRSWATKYRGELIITAATRRPRNGCVILNDMPVSQDKFICGAAIGLVNLVDCRPFTRDDLKAAWMEDWPEEEPVSGYAWVLENARKIEPVPVKGRERLWKIDIPVFPFPA